MTSLWMPGAEKLDIGNHAATDGGKAKAIAHITWDRNATAAKPAALVPYENLRDYFSKNAAGKQVAPHILWDPFTGRISQFFPANSRSLSLRDLAGGTRTNRAGSVVIQVEALFFPHCKVDGKVYAALADTPCKGWPELQAWVHSWGVPNSWPMGAPAGFKSRRSAATWASTGGWYAHGDVPENDHTDPGSWPAFVGATAAQPAKPKYEPFPGASWFTIGRRSPIVAAMHDRLVAVGCNRYKSSANKNVIGSGDVASYEAWQRKCGYSGTAAKWPPGKTTWDKLQVPNV
ncbi:peptidoglycan-binding protein [Streptomyces justiciae]|uniref:Peptidoglycan-binding protein n=1 Tax=Streptomyces justiciae TaxID=2780140 RepID=A0ABU3M804_9ACTN|nr:peptidoglycan-binding protein [Streptomyces justiciae]MDT7847181.1 peptidoglycan-binding protein [Streptomyces justiciae]